MKFKIHQYMLEGIFCQQIHVNQNYDETIMNKLVSTMEHGDDCDNDDDETMRVLLVIITPGSLMIIVIMMMRQ